MSRRVPGSLIPLERQILDVALSSLRSGEGTFHGFALATSLRERTDARSLTAHGTLYKALGRLEEFGLLQSRWEAQAADGRPRRRLYELTAEGALVAARARPAGAGVRVSAEETEISVPRLARESA
jgi:PadR family transcriptional regulator PadR